MTSTLLPRLSLFSKVAALLLAACAQPLLAWTPGTGSPTATSGFVVDPANRTDVLSFYNCIYTASEGYPANIGWAGSVSRSVSRGSGARGRH